MTLISRMRFPVAAAAMAMALLGAPAHAADIAESHLKASYEAIAALRLTDQYDAILPTTAQALLSQLTQKNPDLADKIVDIVKEKTLELAARRADLEKEAAVVYANAFSEAELKEIATFYQGATVKKLIAEGPIATRETIKAVEIWQRGLARDLAEAVGKDLAAAAEAAKAAEPKPEEKKAE